MKKTQAILLIPVLTAVFGTGTAAFWHWANKPYILQADIRGKGADIEWIKEQEKKQKDKAEGILRMAGWRIEKEQQVFSVSTTRKEMAQIIGVYGDMELAADTEIKCGRYGLAVEGDYCILAEKLARELFGSTDILGEQIKLEKRNLIVVGITKEEKAILWLNIDAGNLEMLALEIDGRLREEVKIEEWFK